MGKIQAASQAGERAETTATASPIPSAWATEPSVNEMGAGRLLTYKDSTVLAISLTAAAAISRPSNSPSTPPAKPKKIDSPRNPTKTALRLAPRARRIPISGRRLTTDTAMVL